MILINGCSYSAPNDFGDSWSEGFYNKGFTKNQILNMAVGGSSNLVIRRKTFWCLNDILRSPFRKKLPDYAIIQWSTIDRWDYPVFVNKERSQNFPRFAYRKDWLNKINYMNNGTDVLGYGKNFYENYYSYYGAVIETLENIYHTQKYLEEKHIPYKMITIGNLFDMDVSLQKLKDIQINKNTIKNSKTDYRTYTTNKGIFEKLEPYEDSWFQLNTIHALLDKIDFTKFIFTDDVNISGFGGGIIEWFLNKDEQLDGDEMKDHPSQKQYVKFFNEFLWPKIENEILNSTIELRKNTQPII